MTQTVRELLTELAWIEDSIRRVPLTGEIRVPTNGPSPSSPLNPDLVALAEREKQIIAELRRHRTARA